MSTAPTLIDADELLRKLYELIEYADNSCSEPEDFIRGMQFLFDAAVGHVGTGKLGRDSTPDASSVVVAKPRPPSGPA